MDTATLTRWIDLDLIDLPADARTHDPEDIDDMAAQLKDRNQLQNIIVVQKGDRYEVVAGSRRTLGARKLGWKQIKAEVQESLSEYDRLDIMFSENDGRVDANPIYQSRLLQQMLDTKVVKNQAELAKRKGKTEGWVAQYLGYQKIDPEALKTFTMVKIPVRGLRGVVGLSNEQQRQVAQEISEKKLIPEKVEKRCNQLRFGGKNTSPHPAVATATEGGGEAASDPDDDIPEPMVPSDSSQPDPLSKLWESFPAKVAYRGNLVWSLDHMAYKPDLALQRGVQFFKGLQDALGDACIKMGQSIKEADAGFTEADCQPAEAGQEIQGMIRSEGLPVR